MKIRVNTKRWSDIPPGIYEVKKVDPDHFMIVGASGAIRFIAKTWLTEEYALEYCPAIEFVKPQSVVFTWTSRNTL